MFRTIIAVAAVLSLVGVSAADAAKRKRHKARTAPAVTVPAKPPYQARTPGPPWAQPWECYTDEGYGRYTPCGAGKDD